jgi:hypothetical protein
MKGKLIQIKEASEILGVSKLTLRNWDKAGKLVAFRHPISNYRVYKYSDIENLINMLETGQKIKAVKEDIPPIPPKNNRDVNNKTYNLKVRHIID